MADGASRVADPACPSGGVAALIFDIEQRRCEAKQGIGQQSHHHQPQDRSAEREFPDGLENAVGTLADPSGAGERYQAKDRIEDCPAEIPDAHQIAETFGLARHCWALPC